MSQNTSFEAVYNGPDIDSGSMDVRELAPALLAIGDLVKAANEELNGDRASISVRVKSDFRTGSFHLDLELLQTFLEQAKSLIAMERTISAEVIISAAIALLTVIKALKGRRPENAFKIEALGVSISAENYDRVEVEEATLRLYRSDKVRRAAGRVARTVERPGIESLELRHGHRRETIERQDVPYFEEGPEEVLTEESRVLTLAVVGVFFEEGRMWRFSDGGDTFGAMITDEEFLREIDGGRPFAKGDELVVRMHQVQERVDGKLRMRRTIEKVIEHRRGPEQTKLF